MIPYDQIIAHYKKDAVLYEAIQELEMEIKPELSVDIYLSLLESIVAQQLSIKVVRIIWKRLLDLFPSGYPSPNDLLMMEHSLLRSVGLSNNKAIYVKEVAAFSLENDMSFDHLNALSDEEIIRYLTQIKGVGKWTVQMILMFPMDRPDVFPVDDLGIQNVMRQMYGLSDDRKTLKKEITEISKGWAPYRSLASKYIWEIGGI